MWPIDQLYIELGNYDQNAGLYFTYDIFRNIGDMT